LDSWVVPVVPIEGPNDDIDVSLMKEGLPNVGWHDIYNCVREGRVESIAQLVVGFSVYDHSGLIDSGRVITAILLIIRGEVRHR
jgi:hypothetical protein